MLAIPSDLDFRWFGAWQRPMTWREHLATGLIMLAKKLVGFDSEASFARAVAAIRRSETDVGTNRIPREGNTIPISTQFFIGKSSGAIAKGATTGSVIVWDGATAGALAATSVTLSNVYCPWAAVADAKWVMVLQYQGFYVLIAAEC